MASRAEPGLGAAIRASLADAYVHSIPLVGATLVWSATAIVLVALALFAWPMIVLAPLLAVPTAGLFAMTARMARSERSGFGVALSAWRPRMVAVAMGLGAAWSLSVVVLLVNLVSGLGSGQPVGWVMATLAGWGLVGLWVLAWVAGPILADPRLADEPLMDRLRLAGLVLLARPGRVLGLGVLALAVLIAAIITVAPLLTFVPGLLTLVAAHTVLPVADRYGSRPNQSTDSPAPSTTSTSAPAAR